MNLKKLQPQLLLITYAALLVFLITRFDAIPVKLGTLVSICMPFILAFVIAFVLNRPYMFLTDRVVQPLLGRLGAKGERAVKPISILLTYLLLFAFLGSLVSFVVPQLIDSIVSFTGSLSAHVNNIAPFLDKLVAQYNISGELLTLLQTYWSELLSTLSNLFTIMLPSLISFSQGITTGIYNFISGLILSVYLLTGKQKLLLQSRKLLYAYVPERQADYLMHAAHVANRAFGGFLNGQIIVSLIVGMLCFAGMSILKMPYAVLASVVVGVTNVIPYFGPIIGAVPGTLILLLTEPSKALWFVVLIICIQQFDGNFMSPHIVGGSIGISGVWVMFSIIVGGSIFGVVGMVIGLPAFAVFYALLRESTHARLHAKGRSLMHPEQPSVPSSAPPTEEKAPQQ